MNEAVVPLVCLAAGYIFLRRWNLTRYRWDALEWEHNLFNSAITGGALFAATRLAWKAWDNSYSLASSMDDVRSFIVNGLPFPYVGTLIGTIVVALIAPWPLNRLHKPEESIRSAVDRYGGELLSLLQHAGRRALPVMLTMENRKVYVGIVHAPPSQKYPYTRILPTMSGFRDQETMRVDFTTEYRTVYREITESEPDEERAARRIRDFCIVLPINRICSAHLFDDDTYKKHFRPKTATPGE